MIGLHTDESNVKLLLVAGQAWEIWETTKGGDSRENRVSLLVRGQL